MSMFDEVLNGRLSTITQFLLKEEDFIEDKWHGEDCLQRIASNKSYNCWIMVYEDKIQVFTEHAEIGGEIADIENTFDKTSFDDFLSIYKNILKYVKSMLN